MNIFITLAVAVVAVGLMVLGLSITLMRKGRPMQSDVGDNDAMRERGIICAAAQMRQEEALLRGRDLQDAKGCGKGECGTCAVELDCN